MKFLIMGLLALSICTVITSCSESKKEKALHFSPGPFADNDESSTNEEDNK